MSIYVCGVCVCVCVCVYTDTTQNTYMHIYIHVVYTHTHTHKCTDTHTMEYNSAIKKNEICSNVGGSRDFILSEVNQTQKDEYRFLWNLKNDTKN